MTFTFRPAKREKIPLLLGVAGGTGSGKTYSALRLARGIAKGEPFGFIDTENGRGQHYADEFPEMQHGAIEAPFRPAAYAEAIEAADKLFSVIVVDSASHEWAGDGGCLDWQEEIMKGQESRRLMSWIDPKKGHKRMVTRLLQVNAYVILCFRAEPKVDMVKDKDGKWEFVPKASLTGLDGWLPVSEKNLPYELTASFLLMADAPGVPKPIKLQAQHRPLVPLDAPLTEDVGAALAAWAAGSSSEGQGGTTGTSSQSDAAAIAGDSLPDPEIATLRDRMIAAGEAAGRRQEIEDAIARNAASHTPEAHKAWMQKSLAAAAEGEAA